VSDHEERTARGAAQAGSDVEKWRADFPFTAAGEDEVTRREFVRYLTLGSAGAAFGSVGLAGMTQLRRPVERTPQRIAALDDIPVAGSYLFRYPTPDDPAIVIRPTEDELLAYSQRCTHLACVVIYEHDDDELVCPCHHGIFDAQDGRNVAGPPQRPLNRIDLEVRDGDVWAVGGGGH
jgi:nitrite reductase/ring-hydroxylating ferredoxin subunit